MSARLRPKFALTVDLSADDVMTLVRQRKGSEELPCVLHLYDKQVEFSVRPERRHYWSPFLNLIVEPRASGSVLSGKYGPNINVWTMFLAVYAVSLLVGGVGLLVGLTQAQLGQPAQGLWMSIAAFGVTALAYVTARIGRLLAHPQMLELHEFVESLFAGHILRLVDEEAGRHPREAQP